MMRSDHLPRLLAGLLCAVVLVSCSAGPAPSEPAAATPNEQTGFSYTGARGDTVALDAVPRRIVTDESSASALIPLGIRPVGIWTYAGIDGSPALRGLDLSGIESAGEVFGEVNVEKVAALAPDLIITGYYPLEKQLSGINPDDTTTIGRLEQIAPIATVDATKPASRYIQDFADLARRLGADPNAPSLAADRDAFTAAVEEFTRAVTAKPGLTVTAVSAGDELSIANPDDFAEFLDLRSWGLEMQVPDGVAARGYFKTFSWENVSTEVKGDLLFFDSRPGFGTLADAQAQPTWQRLPAVRAGAIAPWYSDTFTNYRLYTEHLTTFTAAIEKADPSVAG